jgi:HK97 family phage major capsid protein/HK97 family phage prohead protease
MLYRAYSILNVKKVDEGSRTIEGIASTPTPDRLGDIVEPMGADFKLPLPLLWQHDSRQPVGHVTFAKATKDGIPFKATIERLDEPGKLKDRLDEAWQSVKMGLVRAVSIGFKSLEKSFMKEGGIHFLKWEWLELSLVTIAANTEATITSIKSTDRALRAASGQHRNTPGVTGKPKSRVGEDNMKTFAEKIADLEAKAGPKKARMKAIMQTALDDSDRDLNDEESEEFDELAAEVKTMDDQLNRLRRLDSSASTARVVSVSDPDTGVRARAGRPVVEVPYNEKGLGFARYALCYAAAKGNFRDALEIAKTRYPGQMGIQNIIKAQVSGGTTTDANWASTLVYPDNLVSEFIEFLRPMTIVGKFGTGNIPSLRRIPFNVRMPSQTSGGTGYWVGEAKAKPLTRFNFGSVTLRWTKVANIAVISEDLLRFSAPSAELTVRQALAEALQARLDADFIDPAITEVTDVRPPSITNGAANTPSQGDDAAGVRRDLKALLTFFIVNNLSPSTGVWIMTQQAALGLSLMVNANGVREFPDITMMGGTLIGFPVITSQYVPAGTVAFVDANNIFLSDDGGVQIDLSREASLEMDDAPSNDAGVAAVEATMVSMFQTNSVAIRAERMINWRRRRLAAVAYLTGVSWGGDGASPTALV